MRPIPLVLACASVLLFSSPTFAADDPTAQELIDRQAKEKASLWTDGDKVTFFFQGDAEQVTLIIGGESKQLRRLPDSDVWTVTLERPGLEKGVFSYALKPGKKGDPAFAPGLSFKFEKWRGPKAPPAPAVAKELMGSERLVDFDSKSLEEKRKLKIYLPPGHDPAKSYPVVYCADGMSNGDIVEPLILAGKLPPIIAVGVSSGSYRGVSGKPYKIKEDMRACEYLPGIDDDRFAKHEKAFTEEIRAWAEKELGASDDRKNRAVYGISNGGRFSAEMGLRHPDLFGHVLAFSIAGLRGSEPKAKAEDLPTFHLAAGTWEKPFHKVTLSVADKLKGLNVPVVFVSRVAGHDDAMWREEYANALIRTFGHDTASREVPLSLLGSWQNQADENDVILFEPAKCITARAGEPESLRVKRVSREGRKLTFRYWANKKDYAYQQKEHSLTLRELPDGKTTTYRRMDKVPTDVQIKPLALPAAKEIPEEQVASIRDELARRGKIDQEGRTNKDRQKEMPKVDADNTQYLIKLIQDVGWIDVERFGARSANHAFLIVQHSGHIPLMLAALPPIEKDVKAKKLDAQPYALLYDRLQVNLGEKQRYGSQLGSTESGELVLMSLEDPARVEELRKEIGIFPLSKYLKLFEKQNGGKAVKMMEEEP